MNHSPFPQYVVSSGMRMTVIIFLILFLTHKSLGKPICDALHTCQICLSIPNCEFSISHEEAICHHELDKRRGVKWSEVGIGFCEFAPLPNQDYEYPHFDGDENKMDAVETDSSVSSGNTYMIEKKEPNIQWSMVISSGTIIIVMLMLTLIWVVVVKKLQDRNTNASARPANERKFASESKPQKNQATEHATEVTAVLGESDIEVV